MIKMIVLTGLLLISSKSIASPNVVCNFQVPGKPVISVVTEEVKPGHFASKMDFVVAGKLKTYPESVGPKKAGETLHFDMRGESPYRALAFLDPDKKTARLYPLFEPNPIDGTCQYNKN